MNLERCVILEFAWHLLIIDPDTNPHAFVVDESMYLSIGCKYDMFTYHHIGGCISSQTKGRGFKNF